MSSVNKVILIGNCGRDPESRFLASGMGVCNVSIATSSKRKDKNTGEVIEDTQWHRVVFYDKLAEIAGKYLKKGKSAYVEGRLKYGKYTDKDGVERNTVDVVAESMQLLGGVDQDAPRSRNGPIPRQEPQRQAPSHDAARARQTAPPPRQSSGFYDMDDDIPY